MRRELGTLSIHSRYNTAFVIKSRARPAQCRGCAVTPYCGRAPSGLHFKVEPPLSSVFDAAVYAEGSHFTHITAAGSRSRFVAKEGRLKYGPVDMDLFIGRRK
ncbi:hypothetical protein EVAR_44369_1 [Eumeta japonica]|uniref:Uncharacterized protein n=1 Tax=Eumeta variegata TaxID=151549 RepID=A0A4C1X9U3_EUMVA|nr:hypothetical protein EVAR_44369_1 [Eumeta japonica]